MKLTNIFQMYMGWDINGLADMEHNNRFICGGTYNDTEKLSDKKRSRTICGKSRRYPGSDHNGKRMESRRRAGGQSLGANRNAVGESRICILAKRRR